MFRQPIGGKQINRGIFMLGTLLKWFGGSGKSKRDANDCDEGSPKLGKLYEGDRGIHDLANHDEVLRLWLPLPLRTAMGECMDVMGVPAAKYLREFLVVYLYGAHELLRMKAEDTGLYYVPPPPPPSEPAQYSPGGIRFSRARTIDCIPDLGKNIVPVKLFLHKKMKADLEALANKADTPLGQFVREILVSHFLGHTIWPERKQFWTEEQQRFADEWEDGKIEEVAVFGSTPEIDEALEGKIVYINW